jgi:hypothetical protein
MRLSDLTAVGRLVDPRYPTNLVIVILAALVTAGAAACRWVAGSTLLDGALWGIGAGLAIFLAWALARELDPDHDLSAFVAVALAIVALAALGLPPLLPLFWILLVMRVVNRTVGLPARPLDSLAVLGLGLWLTWQASWIYGLMTAVALFLDGWLAPRLGRHRVLAAIVVVGTVVLAVLGSPLPRGDWDSVLLTWLYALTAILFSMAMVTLKPARALCDATGEPLRPARVRVAQGLALVTALLLAGLAGQEGMEALLPLWAAMLGTALHELGARGFVALRSGHSEAREDEPGGAG